MDISVLRDAPDAFGDIHLPDALDIDLGDVAGQAVEFAGDAATVVVTQGGRGVRRVIRVTRQNPKATLGVLAVIVILVALFAAQRRSSSQSETDNIA